MVSNSRVRNKFRLNNEISISYLETGILKEHNHLERNNRIYFCLIFLSSLSVFYTDIMNLEKQWESCPLNFSPIYILDPKLLVSILTFRVLKCQFFNKICIFGRYRIEDSPIDYLQNKYTYVLIKISPMSKVCWLLQSSWKQELKLSYNSSLRYKRRRFKNALENYKMEQIFFKAMSVAILLV